MRTNQVVTSSAAGLCAGLLAVSAAPATSNDVDTIETIDVERVENAEGAEPRWEVDLGVTTRDEAVGDAEGELKLLDQRFNILQEQSDATDPSARRQWQDQLESLKAKRDALEGLLDQQADLGDKTWLEMSPSLRQARDDFADALDEAEAYYTDTVKSP